jgi:hypothetical protein
MTRTEAEVRAALAEMKSIEPMIRDLNVGVSLAMHLVVIDTLRWMLGEPSAFETAMAKIQAIDAVLKRIAHAPGGVQ